MMATNTKAVSVYSRLLPKRAAVLTAQQELLHQHRESEYYYVYVSESEVSNIGHWIVLEPDKTLSLQNLRSHYATCFGIKYRVCSANNNVETKYIPYHNGFYRFPPGLDLNKIRFIAYYYTDSADVQAFMDMTEKVSEYGNTTIPLLLKNNETQNDSTLLGQTALNFEMEAVLLKGAQSTPKNGPDYRPMENVSSTSDVILNEVPPEIITVDESVAEVPFPPPPAPPQPTQPPSNTNENELNSVKPGPSVSSTSDIKRERNSESGKRSQRKKGITDDSNELQNQRSTVTVKCSAPTKNRRYQSARSCPVPVGKKTPVKMSMKSRGKQDSERIPFKITVGARGRQGRNDSKILRIEDERGRTTALLTKKKWAGFAPEDGGSKRRSEDECREIDRYKRRRHETHRPYYQERIPTKLHDDFYARSFYVLLVGFQSRFPSTHEVTRYFSEFGIVENLELYTMESRSYPTEYYGFMKITSSDVMSLFSSRHLYNGTAIYAIRIDGNRLPSRISCKVCGHQGLNVSYVHYHLEGQYHQFHLQKRLDSLAANTANVYDQSYYRITYDEIYVQYPSEAVQDLIRSDYWKRDRIYSNAVMAPNSRYYSTERERYY